jgi:iron complex outermembrane receptor protein
MKRMFFERGVAVGASAAGFSTNGLQLAVMATVAAVALQSGRAHAQADTPTQAQAASLKEITVTGNPLGATDLIAPVVQYSGGALLLRSKSTLGETLDGAPGVSSTYFGPNASRPIIRGMDGDRIRILGNGGATSDASSLSFDHAVTSDPISVERVEVLRGPGTLLYGGSAVGGVVNVIDNRIPREALFDEKGGVSGKLNLDAATGNREKAGAALVETGNDRYALHVDGFNRRTGDVSVPISLACGKTGATGFANRICNSASKSDGGALGGSVFFGHGYLGASASTFRSTYGTVAEDNVTVGMKSDRVALEGELRDLAGFFKSVKGQYSHTDYMHTEFTGGVPGTVFRNKGGDFRLEARHRALAGMEGVIGLQAQNTRFSAVGAEAFAPYSQTSQNAAFVYEEYGTGWGRLSLGARLDSIRVESLGNPAIADFVPASREFRPASYALGSVWKIRPDWQLTGNLGYTERAPKDYELYAYGPHIATRAWETGNAALGKEKSLSLDVGANWKSGADSFSANVYQYNFKNYIALLATGRTFSQEDRTVNPVDVNGDGSGILPEYAYTGVRARFRGFEASGNIRMLQGASTLDLALRSDLVRATNLTNGQPLPRIAPMRLGATLQWAGGPWGSSFGFDHSAAQRRVAPGQRATDAYTLWNAAATYALKSGRVNTLLYAKLDNLTNQLAYSAASVLTTTAFPKAPLPGRSLKIGLQAAF